jgi:hypothetical protein
MIKLQSVLLHRIPFFFCRKFRGHFEFVDVFVRILAAVSQSVRNKNDAMWRIVSFARLLLSMVSVLAVLGGAPD